MAKIDINKFLGKSKEYTIMGETVLLEPLKGKDFDLLTASGKDESKVAKDLIKSYFELSDEEFDKLPLTFISEASKAIADVNGLSE